jgi:SAM-dependent methyltransferase
MKAGPAKRRLKAVLRALGLTRVSQLAAEKIRERGLNTTWETRGALRQRKYKSEDQYKNHQKSKLSEVDPEWLNAYDSSLRSLLQQRIGGIPKGSRVLCLAARKGGEVRAFLDQGCFAVGVDLNPGLENQYVIAGDFHHLQFGNQCVDVIYTNSLDHVRDLSKVVQEMRRVLTPDGLILIEASRGTEEGYKTAFWESFAWASVDDLIEVLRNEGLEFVSRSPFDQPWPGEHLRFKPAR